MKLHNCYTCENLNDPDHSCAVLEQNARPTMQQERALVFTWRRKVHAGESTLVMLPAVTADGCPGYVSDDPNDYPVVDAIQGASMIPLSVEQLKEAIHAVEALNDPLVEWEPSGCFGYAAPARKLDPAKLYVNVHEVDGASAYCVKQVIQVSVPFQPNAHFSVPNEILRWHFAKPPWGHPRDLPDLATAIALHRLPQEAFPKPEVGCTYTLTGINVGGVEVPLWRFMQATGRIL